MLSVIPHSIRILVELLSSLARQQKLYYHLQQAQSLIPYNYIPYVVGGVQQFVSLVEYCTFVYNKLFKEKCCCTPVCTTC